jgi:hypothetical protein
VAAQHRDAALRDLAAAGVDRELAEELRQTADYLLDRDY